MAYDPIRMRLEKNSNLLKTVKIYHAFACFDCIPSPFYDFCWASVLLFTMTLSVPKGGVFHLWTPSTLASIGRCYRWEDFLWSGFSAAALSFLPPCCQPGQSLPANKATPLRAQHATQLYPTLPPASYATQQLNGKLRAEVPFKSFGTEMYWEFDGTACFEGFSKQNAGAFSVCVWI